MQDADKSREELLEELLLLRQRNTELERARETHDASAKIDEHLLLLDTIDTHVFYLSDPSTYGMVNKAHADFFGAHKRDLAYKNLYDMLSTEEAIVCEQGNLRIFREKKQIVTEEWMQRADGEKRLFRFTKTPRLDENSDVVYVVCTGEDITDSMQAREELRANKHFLENVIESIQDGMSVLDREYTIVHTNAVMREWYKESGPLVGQKCFKAYHGNDTACDPCPTRRAFASGKTESNLVPGLPGSSAEWLEVFSYPLKDQEKDEITGVVEFVRDVTDRVKLQKQIIQVQKMEAIGTLAGGIAHDFNNLLLGMQGRASLMGVDLATDDPHQEHIKAIEDHIRSATGLTKQLLGIARGGKYEPKPIDLNALVTESVTMFGRTRKEIQIGLKMAPGPVVAEVDRSQIEQVLLNIYVNAAQAMAGGGELSIETRIVILDEASCQPHEVPPGHYVRIAARDTGIGMDEMTRQRIFDPFFTTKDKEWGTGLGLASAYGIIKNHNGFITVSSEVGRGSTFTIFLPVSKKDVNHGPDAPTRIVKGSETVLLVDDEEMIIQVGQAMLRKLGYQVLVAEGGPQAIEMVSARGDAIDLVILDLIMPHMDGGKVFDQIRQKYPAMPILLSSGYAIEGQAAEIMSRGCNGFIQKPFSIADVSQKIRQILDPVS